MSCKKCGAVTGLFSSGRPRKFCGPSCYRRQDSPPNEQGKSCAQCGRAFTSVRAHQRYCSAACKWTARDRRAGVSAFLPIPAALCRGCARAFKPRKRENSNYCSRECAFRNSEHWRRKVEVAPKFSRVFFPVCRACGHQFLSRRKGVRVCSPSCYSAFERDRSRQMNVAKRAPFLTPRRCPECGVDFTPKYGQKARRFCSVEHGDRHHARLQRRRRDERLIRNGLERFNELEVLARDGWRCCLCGIETPRELRGTFDPRAPEIDHIIPVSRGGPHTRRNTQCACRRCNLLKGDSVPAFSTNWDPINRLRQVLPP